MKCPKCHFENPSDSSFCSKCGTQISCRQEAKSLELRAIMSLNRLLQKQGKQEEARKLLTEIYSWFTEGFDTPDLKETKASGFKKYSGPVL
jgi:predicted ATPase